MKKTAILGSLCLILTASLFSCKKDSVTPEADITTTSTVNAAALNAGTAKTDAVLSDDTRALQSQLNAGNVTLTAGKTYHVTQLKVTHALDMNGATIIMNTTGYGFALSLTADGASVTNGTLTGLWNNTTKGNPSGYSGIYILANHCSVSHMNISSFSAYGIVAGPVNSSSVTYCNISNTGYIGYFYDAESKSTTGGTFSNNVVDRSMVPASTVTQMAVGIRGSVNNANVTATNWTITNNTIKMPLNPTDWTAECSEIRYCNNAYIANNVTTAGSIGLSIVYCTGNVLQNNTTSGAKLEGIEFADCNNCKTWNNIIPSSLGAGILIDGGTGCNGIQLNGDKISGTAQECIHAYKKTQNLTIYGATLTSAASGTFGINLQNTTGVKIQSTKIIGNGIGNIAVVVDNCPGNITLTGGSVANFKSCVVSIYNSTKGLKTDNVSMSGVTVSGTPNVLNSVLMNGGLLGSNINLSL
jgi:hypothetical protein